MEMTYIPIAVNSSVLQFADDLKMFRVIKGAQDFQELQNDIDKVLAWAKKWQLQDSMFLSVTYCILVLHMVMVGIICRVIEYGNTIWGPYFTVDLQNVEKVQRRATRILASLHDNSYSERLHILGLPTLNYKQFFDY